MRIGLAGQHDWKASLEEALRFAVLTLIPAHAAPWVARHRTLMPMSGILLKQYGFRTFRRGRPACSKAGDHVFRRGKGMAFAGWRAAAARNRSGCRNEGCKAGRGASLQLLQTKSSTAAGSSAFPATTPCSARAFAAFVLEQWKPRRSGLCKERSGRRSTIIRGGSSETMICLKNGSAASAPCR